MRNTTFRVSIEGLFQLGAVYSLWNVCDAKHSHICSVAVPILLHCVTLAAGADVLCALLRDEFHHPDLATRFTAVERVTILIRYSIDNNT